MSDNSDSDDSGRSSQNERLLDAAEGGTSEDVQRLIQEGADIHVVDDRHVIKS